MQCGIDVQRNWKCLLSLNITRPHEICIKSRRALVRYENYVIRLHLLNIYYMSQCTGDIIFPWSFIRACAPRLNDERVCVCVFNCNDFIRRCSGCGGAIVHRYYKN